MTINQQIKKEELMTAFSKTIELFGLSTLESRLFSFMYLENRPLTLDDMSEALGKSKTAMSTGIRSLAKLNLVSQVWKKGERKDLYIANSELLHSFADFYLNQWINSTNRQRKVLEDFKDNTDKQWDKNEDSKERERFFNKLGAIIAFHGELAEAFQKIKKDIE